MKMKKIKLTKAGDSTKQELTQDSNDNEEIDEEEDDNIDVESAQADSIKLEPSEHLEANLRNSYPRPNFIFPPSLSKSSFA